MSGTWVILGANSNSTKQALWSSDGITWNDASSTLFNNSSVGSSVTYSQDKLLCGTNNNPTYHIGVSYDGQTWTNTESSPPYVNVGRLTYGDRWIATGYTGNANNVYESPDGDTWTLVGVPFGGIGSACSYYHSGQWVVGGYNPSNDTTIKWTDDFTTWHDASGTFNNICKQIQYSLGLWVAVGYDTSGTGIKWSLDGKEWNDSSGTAFEFAGGNSVFYGNGTWVAAGNGTGGNQQGTSMLWSSDGMTWNDCSGGFYNCVATDVFYNGTTWIAVGNSDANGVFIKTSTNGQEWSDVADPTGWYAYSVAYIPPTTTTTTATPFLVTTTTIPETTTTTSPETTTTTTSPETTTTSPETTTTTTIPPPCFVAGTQILTPAGYRNVEDIQSGDFIVTADKRRVPVKLYSFTTKATVDTAPFRIAASALGPGYPKRDLRVSPRHAIKDARGLWQIPKYLAYHNKNIKQYGVGESVTYYHVECPNFYKDNLVAEGTEVESYKNRQGSSGVVYMWSDSLHGWERVQGQKLPKTLTTHVIYSI